MKTMCPPGYHHNGFVTTHASCAFNMTKKNLNFGIFYSVTPLKVTPTETEFQDFLCSETDI